MVLVFGAEQQDDSWAAAGAFAAGAAAGFDSTGAATEQEPFAQEEPLLPKILSTDSAPRAMPAATTIENIPTSCLKNPALLPAWIGYGLLRMSQQITACIFTKGM